MVSLTLPHNFVPRPYQLRSLQALDDGAKRVVAVWHRRAGKEKTFINYTAKASAQRVGTYLYLFPTFKQARRVLWDGMDKTGFKFLDHFPKGWVVGKREDEMKLTFANGSIFQLVGTDNFDAIMGSNPIGCVFSEYSLQDPSAWEFIRPILRENGGWAVFDYTPRGKNHGKDLYDMAMELMSSGDPNWYCERLSIADTGVLTEEDMIAERREGMSEEMIQQEYYCSFEGIMEGAIFGKQMDEAEKDGRICAVPYDPAYSVDTWWDIGTGDPTAIWFTQDVGREVHVIDHYSNSGVGIGIDHYAKVIQDKPYVYSSHNGPHDLEAHQFAAGGKSAKEVAANLGIKFKIVPKHSVQDGIQATRLFLKKCWFDREKTKKGRDALVSYHFQWDEKRKMFLTTPYHDWASNDADAARYLAMGHKTYKAAPEPIRRRVFTTLNETEPSQAWMGR